MALKSKCCKFFNALVLQVRHSKGLWIAIIFIILLVPRPVHLEAGSFTSGAKKENSQPFVKNIFSQLYLSF